MGNKKAVQSRPIASNGGQASRGFAAGATVQAAVFGFLVLRPLRTHGEENGRTFRDS